jgi:hypothetical protein
MLYAVEQHYVRMAEAIERGPQTYGGDPSIVALRCFRRYHKDATVDLQDGFGRDRWITRKQARIHAVLLRHAVAGTPVTMQAVARETRVCPSTVSRAVLKFQAWGMFAIDITRGRNGGMRIMAATVSSYVSRAKAKMRELLVKAGNVAFTLMESMERVTYPSRNRDATFRAAVLHERLMLAYADPIGENEAVVPLDVREEPGPIEPMSDDEHWAMLEADMRRRQEQLRRQAAFDGDWELWDRIGKELNGA